MAKKAVTRRGIFITFEGSEGSGKSTHSRLILRHLQQSGFDCVYIREPGGTEVSEKIRKILLDPCHKTITPVAEMLLYMVARCQLAQEVIKPALARGAVVICDRFLDSTIAYQGYGLGLDIKVIKYVARLVMGDLKPDMTVLLDIQTRVGLSRTGAVKDRIERRTLSYHERVRRGYLALARLDPARVKIVKANNRSKESVQSEIRGLVLEVCRLRRLQATDR